MAFEQMFFDLDFRNSSIGSQADIFDTFFQNNTMEFWDIGENEVMFGTFDAGVTTGATRFTIFDAGVEGIKGNLSDLNSNTALSNFVAANRVIRMKMVEDRIILVQHIAR